MTHSIRHAASWGMMVAAAVIFLLALVVALQGGLLPDPSQVPSGLSDVTTLGQLILGQMLRVIDVAAAALGVVIPMWIGAAGWGYPCRRMMFPQACSGFVLQMAVGMAVMLVLAWLLAWAGLINVVTAWGLCGLGTVGVVAQLCRLQVRRAIVHGHWDLHWTTLLALPVLALLTVACGCHPGTLWSVEAFGYDVTSYHLQIPREWLALGAMRGLEHNVYSFQPRLVEVGYMLIGAMKGSMYAAVYPAQFFHASGALFASVALGRCVALFAGPASGRAVGALFISVPWVLVTGSLAYNEMYVLAFGAAALLVMFDSGIGPRRSAALAGFLAGAATLAKLTAGPMVAVPVGLILLLRLNRSRDRGRVAAKDAILAAAIAAGIGMATLLPYMARNAAATGNPIFPFATSVFGLGHWSEEIADRWNRAHRDPPLATYQRLAELGRQWLCNSGYGSVFGRPRAQSSSSVSRDIARFETEWGFPLLGLAVIGGGLLSFRHRPTRHLAVAMVVMLVVQVNFWLWLTHLQSRFLLPTLLPALLLLGAGLGRLSAGRWRFPLVVTGLGAALTILSFGVFHGQVRGVLNDDGHFHRLAPWQIVANLPPLEQMESGGKTAGGPINELGSATHTFLVADNARLLYIRRPISYHSAFDVNPLGEMIRQHGPAPDAITRALRGAGFTHIWVHLGELNRLAATYGFDPDVTPEQLDRLIRSGWQQIWQHDRLPIALYELPQPSS